MRIIALVSGKGGVGKTTIATNLGVLLAGVHRKHVITVDCNLTAPHVGMYLGMDYTPLTINHVLRGEADVHEALYNHPSGMKVVPSSIPLKDLDGVDPFRMQEAVKRLYDRYVGKADFVLLDCAPGLGRDALAGIRASDEILFVTIPTLPAVMDIVRATHVVRDLGVRHVGIALNMTRGEKWELSPQEVERTTGLPVVAMIPSDKLVRKSLFHRSPVTMMYPKSKASRSLNQLAGALLQQTLVTPHRS